MKVVNDVIDHLEIDHLELELEQTDHQGQDLVQMFRLLGREPMALPETLKSLDFDEVRAVQAISLFSQAYVDSITLGSLLTVFKDSASPSQDWCVNRFFQAAGSKSSFSDLRESPSDLKTLE
jgi:hypothetical protein